MPKKKKSESGQGKQNKLSRQDKRVSGNERTFLLLLLAVIVILLVIIASLVVKLNGITGMIVCKEGDTDCLQDNCECVEEGIRFCPEGFELTGKLCKRDKDITNSLLRCSRYECKYDVDLLE